MNLTVTQANVLIATQNGTYNPSTAAQKGRRTRLVKLGLISNMNGLIGYHLTPAGRDALAAYRARAAVKTEVDNAVARHLSNFMGVNWK